MTDQEKVDPFAPLDEKGLRRPDFAGGVPVRLIDGNEWYVAEPMMRFAPSESDVGFQIILSIDDDGTFNELATRYQSLSLLPHDELESYATEYASLEMRMGRMMLERNYRLNPKQIRRILQTSYYEDQDPSAAEIRKSIIRIILGDVPKPSAGGEGPSVTPPACEDSTTAC